MLSAIYFNLDQSKILLFGKGLKVRSSWQRIDLIMNFGMLRFHVIEEWKRF